MKSKAKLTSSMQKTLIDLLNGNQCRHNSNTINTLTRRGLVSSGMLTQAGRELAITFLPLEQQCEQLGLPIYEAVGPYNSDPEHFLWRHFEGVGFCAAHCEGGAFLTLIKAAALSILAEINTFGSRDDACTRFLEAQFVIHKERMSYILNTIEHATLRDVEENFEEIYKHSIVQEAYPGLKKEFISSLFIALGPPCLRNIAEFLFEDPYCYRNGWPDLTLLKDDKIWLCEVKTTDRLHLSQVKTIPRIQNIIPARIAVIQIKQGLRCSDDFTDQINKLLRQEERCN
jgi:hypothetical protein